MIEGLNVVVKTAELQQLCLQQAEWHETRAAMYRTQLEGMKQLMDDPSAGEAGKFQNNSNMDPQQSMKSKAAQHQNSAREMKFIAEHLSPNDTYLLDHAAMAKLGIVRSSGFF